MSTVTVEIAKEEDRLIIGQILLKNGYTVKFGRVKKDNGRQYIHFVEVEK